MPPRRRDRVEDVHDRENLRHLEQRLEQMDRRLDAFVDRLTERMGALMETRQEDMSDDAFFVAGGDGEPKFDEEEEIVTMTGPPQRMLSDLLHSFMDSSQGGILFRPAQLPMLGLSEGDKRCTRDHSTIMAQHFFADKSEDFINARVNALLHSLDIESDVRGKGLLLGDSGSWRITGMSRKKACDKPSWNPFSYFKFSRDADDWGNKVGQQEVHDDITQPIPMKGRAILYTRLGCQECKEATLFFYRKRLRYVEINIDVYPSRKLKLEKISGSSSVPKVFFNEVLIRGINEMKGLEESEKLKDKLDFLISESPSPEPPLPPFSGEDDVSSSGAIGELAVVVRKMKESTIVKDRLYKMQWFTNYFVGSEAVDFLSEDQYPERAEAVAFGRKLAGKLFF
ncbi:hypothetical protein CRG98_041721 [Punica granatum]|uniref:Glutaredoxin domain-containing protein n=1 Tax=Punica granatum TaxID=22663 RepID=A0A2I0I1P8_PUNGR|nr:hypothetical protein CRG98_041721 [Punica granatum]